jgi:hypothetical protein
MAKWAKHKNSIVISVRVPIDKKKRWKEEADGDALSGFIEDAVDNFIETRRRRREGIWLMQDSKKAS